MKKYSFKIGDLLVSEQGTCCVVENISISIAGNSAIYLMVSERKDILDVIPFAIVDSILTIDIDSGRYKYYPVVK